MIPTEDYKLMVENLPILCVDIVLKVDNKFLLVKRKNEPLKNQWWLVGGRLKKGELVEEACRRKALEEIGIKIDNLKFLGFYEDFFEKSSFGYKPYHTVSLVYESDIGHLEEVILDEQSEAWALFNKLPDRFKIKK